MFLVLGPNQPDLGIRPNKTLSSSLFLATMPPHSTTSKKGQPFGKAQASFIRETRSSIDANAKSFFKGKDWRNITPCGGRFVGGLSSSPLPLESFYVKPIACFVPHHLLPNHTPTCPHCESSSDVLTSGSMVKWIRQPKICYRVGSHRYLDTKLYYCHLKATTLQVPSNFLLWDTFSSISTTVFVQK